mmetsp:Transcript_19312/g.55016  ORF Transcript_19312/g.55016 Transcript_19312/m.55016 type:complete len:284 (+) Transcript_19312:684-1535(+)
MRRAALGLLAAAPRAGAEIPVLTNPELADTNKDGAIDKSEFMLTFRDILNADDVEDKDIRTFVYRLAETLYDIGDIDRDGVHSRRETEFVVMLIGSELYRAVESADMLNDLRGIEDEFGGATARSLVARFDRNTNFAVDRDEFTEAFEMTMRGHGVSDEALEGFELHKALRETFDTADIDGDGRLYPRELQFAMFLANKCALREMTDKLFMALDASGDGQIDYEEVMQAVERERARGDRQAEALAEALLQNFNIADINSDGMLGPEEADNVAQYLLPVFGQPE